ncbi:MAG: RNA-binding S4 domain-containing protein [Verrucomicrobia bacterium]|nr:RNA-binding S4 domain-containing protein [Verrucomicrobiota bacterium]
MNPSSAKPTASAKPREVVVREVPIELCQFIKFGGLSGSGGEAKQLIAEGSVLLNGVLEKQKRGGLPTVPNFRWAIASIQFDFATGFDSIPLDSSLRSE